MRKATFHAFVVNSCLLKCANDAILDYVILQAHAEQYPKRSASQVKTTKIHIFSGGIYMTCMTI